MDLGLEVGEHTEKEQGEHGARGDPYFGAGTNSLSHPPH